MPGTEGSHLTILISIGHSESSIELTSPELPGRDRPRKSLRLRCPLLRSELDSLRTSARQELDDFAKAANRAKVLNPQRWALLDQAMVLLRKLGSTLAFALFEWEDLPTMVEFCKDACLWEEDLAIPPQVEIIVDDLALLPFEFVPVFRIASKGRIKDAHSFEDEARSYLGFKTVIKRTIRNMPGQGKKLVGDPDLRTRIFQYADVQSISRVVSVLQRSKKRKNPVFPTVRLSQLDFEMQMGKLLTTAEEHIFYFGCHCDTSNSNPLRHCFLLSADGLIRYSMDLKTIITQYITNGPRKGPGPLVFMNACGGASVLPSGQTSLPALFLQNKCVGYIGTESIIPDDTAASFATLFFGRFFDGASLGEAIFEARKELLHRGNPLGILYTAYAPSEMLALKGN